MRTHVTFVLDSSGSMSKIADDTKGGFNTFLLDQQEADGEATVSLYSFDTTVRCLYEGLPVDEAERLTDESYTPGGRTALHDALSTAITDTAAFVETRPPGSTPEQVIVVTLTDGKENASETPQKRVRDLVERYRHDHDWEFMFIGANQDAALTAERVGMDRSRSLTMAHSDEGASAAYDSVSKSVSEARRTGDSGGFDAEDRRRQRDAPDE